MKSFVIGLLGSALLLNGCYSVRSLRPERKELSTPDADKKIRVTLVDGSEIEAEPYHHVKVVEPSDFVYGVGKMYLLDLQRGASFEGRVPYSSIDSSRIITRGSDKYLVCWLSGKRPIDFDDAQYQAFIARLGARLTSRIEFQEGDYLNVTADGGAGLWCVGTLETEEEKSDFVGRIPYEKIKEIEVRKFSIGKTALSIVVVFGTLVALIALSGGPFGGGSFFAPGSQP